MTPQEAYALALAAVQADGDDDGMVSDPADYWEQPSGALSWCFAPEDNSPGSFFVHVAADGTVRFTVTPSEDEA